MTDIDPAAVIAAHKDHYNGYCGPNYSRPGIPTRVFYCEPYRLASALEAERARADIAEAKAEARTSPIISS